MVAMSVGACLGGDEPVESRLQKAESRSVKQGLVAAKAGADAHRHHNRLIGYLDSRPPACGDTFGRIRQPCTLRCSNLLGQGASVCHSIRPGAEGSMIQIVSEKVA